MLYLKYYFFYCTFKACFIHCTTHLRHFRSVFHYRNRRFTNYHRCKKINNFNDTNHCNHFKTVEDIMMNLNIVVSTCYTTENYGTSLNFVMLVIMQVHTQTKYHIYYHITISYIFFIFIFHQQINEYEYQKHHENRYIDTYRINIAEIFHLVRLLGQTLQKITVNAVINKVYNPGFLYTL